MNILNLAEKFKGSTVVINFMEGTPSYEKYGPKVVGKLTIQAYANGERTSVVVLKGLSYVTKSYSETWSNKNIRHTLSLEADINSPMTHTLASEVVEKLKTEGFSCFDIEPNGLRKLDIVNL